MVDELRLQRLLRQIADTVAFLEAESGAPPDVRSQRRWIDSLKYNFIAVIECCIDVGQHICAAQGWGPPNSNADVFRTLAQHGVLPAALADDLARAAGFRNILVHEYVAVRDDVVVANLECLHDLRLFISAVASWLISPESAEQSR